MEVFEMPAKVSWTTKLIDMQVGEKLVTHIKNRATISPRISREIKLMHPDRCYKTDAKSEPDKLIITRIK